VTVVRCRRTRLFYNIKRLIYVNKKSVHLESRYGSDTYWWKEESFDLCIRVSGYHRPPTLYGHESVPFGVAGTRRCLRS